MSFASPYKGSERGHVYTMSSVRLNSSGNGGGVLAQTPVASMGSTSIFPSLGISSSITKEETLPVMGIRTSASSIQGGITTADKPNRRPGSVKRSGGETPLPTGACTECHWVWDPVSEDYVCSVCGSHAFLGCDHMDEEGYCWCPLDFNWAVALFMAILAAAYGVYKKRTSTLK